MIRAYSNLLRVALFGSALLPAVSLYALPFAGRGVLDVILYLFLALLLSLALHRLLVRLQPFLAKRAAEQRAWRDSTPERFLPFAIAGSAAVSLCLELSLIRWQGSLFEVFSFYKNFGLLACFAGLGVGYALARNREIVPLEFTPALFGWQFAFLLFLRYGLDTGASGFSVVPFREQLSMGLRVASAGEVWTIHLLLAVVFLLTALTLIPVGQLCGCLMERRNQVSSYGWNLLGSLAGVGLIFLTSFLWTPPVVWFCLCFVVLLFFFARTPSSLLPGVALMITRCIPPTS
jgi:hypothetical protein